MNVSAVLTQSQFKQTRLTFVHKIVGLVGPHAGPVNLGNSPEDLTYGSRIERQTHSSLPPSSVQRGRKAKNRGMKRTAGFDLGLAASFFTCLPTDAREQGRAGVPHQLP